MKIGHKIQHYLKNSHLTEYKVGINSCKDSRCKGNSLKAREYSSNIGDNRTSKEIRILQSSR